MRFLLYYLLVLNAISFLCFGMDKHISQVNGKDIHAHRRIPEATLLWLAILGGSVGAIAGMYFFRHKTHHLKFTLLLPLILLAQLLVVAYFVVSWE